METFLKNENLDEVNVLGKCKKENEDFMNPPLSATFHF